MTFSAQLDAYLRLILKVVGQLVCGKCPIYQQEHFYINQGLAINAVNNFRDRPTVKGWIETVRRLIHVGAWQCARMMFQYCLSSPENQNRLLPLLWKECDMAMLPLVGELMTPAQCLEYGAEPVKHIKTELPNQPFIWRVPMTLGNKFQKGETVTFVKRVLVVHLAKKREPEPSQQTHHQKHEKLHEWSHNDDILDPV